jgi:uncharacterized phage protein gp47/JayE
MNTAATFDDFLNQILLDYQERVPDVDRSEKALVFIKSAAMAGALWALRQQQINDARKPFPDKCDLPDLIHHAANMGITDISSYIDDNGTFSRLAAAVVDRDQNPEGAGNEHDWLMWAMECSYDHGDYIEHVTDAKSYEHKRYIGSIDVCIVCDRTAAQGGEQEPSAELLAVVKSHLGEKRSFGIASDLLVHSFTKVPQALTLTVTSAAVEATPDVLAAIKADIVALMKGIRGGESYYPALVNGLAIARNVTPVNLDPDANVTVQTGPAAYERIWPDVDNIVVESA